MITTALARLMPLKTDPVDQYPQLVPLQKAVKAADWTGVASYFAGLPARSDKTQAVSLVSATAGAEKFLQRAVDTERDSALARTLLGARFIDIGWKARSAVYAMHVKQAQWQIFFDYLQRAERLLADATAIDPTEAAAWTQRIVTARGLSLGIDEARRRYEKAAEHSDAPYTAQRQLIQNLCPKWGGSTAELHTFAGECLASGKPGTLAGAIVADAHVEHAITNEYVRDAVLYLGKPDVVKSVTAAAAQTVLHPDFQPGFGSVGAHSVFAFALHTGGSRHAEPHFAALGNRAGSYPWDMLHQDWKKAFRQASRSARSW
ncbi:hypothetical protein HDA40_000791 [Hamadaea flava]|uniref:Uncharacterized protein n=1 Tax=Hamadaea flava TaxID=1742688 RepID=A0ABV8LS60_9ACTN|nr:hypothetical protein [Hamadaea flava]MCP2322284.1 hypothetical protein [Hamadaea flava]